MTGTLRRTQPVRLILGASAALMTVVVLTGCSTVGDFVAREASDTACAAITPIIDQVTADVRTAVSEIPVDPAAAIDSLQAAGVLLGTLPGQSDAVDTARTALDALITETQAVQLGQRLDQNKVDELSNQLTEALKAAIGVC